MARVSLAQVRLMLLGGMLTALLVFQAIPSLPGPETWVEAEVEPEPAPIAATDPHAESRRSRLVLEAQEGGPPPVKAGLESGSGAVVSTGRVHVIDGDTFIHAGERIRIADIDTPEVHGRCPAETALADRATRRLRALLAQGPFELHPLPSGRDEDRYGRKLRIVTQGGRSIGDMLVAEGLARTWTGKREPWCAGRLS